WEAGIALDWKSFHSARDGRKLQLPLYPFDEIEYPIDVEEFQRFTSSFAGPEASAVTAVQRPAPQPVGVSVGGAAVSTHPRRLEWTRSAPPFSAMKEQRKVLMAVTDDVARLKSIMAEIPHWRVLHITFGDQYTFQPPSGAVVRPNH